MKLDRWFPCLLLLGTRSSANETTGDARNGFPLADLSSQTLPTKEPGREETNAGFWESLFDWDLQFTFIFYNDFESGWEDFNSGGAYALRDDSGTWASSGQASLEIYNNFGTASSVITNVIDVSSHLALRMEFWFYPRNFSGGAPVGFAVEYKTGSVWEEARYYLYGTDFVNSSWQRDVQLIDTYGLSFIEIRIRCDGYGDTVYLDDIELLGLS